MKETHITKETAEKLVEIIISLKQMPVIVVAQVDPDAIACAVCMTDIIRSYSSIGSKIIYGGRISHPQNRAIVNRYDLGMVPLANASEEEQRVYAENPLILVDSSCVSDNRVPMLAIAKERLAVIIDHHRNSDVTPQDDQFVLIEDVGACSTLMMELATQLLHAQLDTATYALLALGIYTDTKSLTAASARDFAAYQKATELAGGAQVLSSLINYPLPASYFKNLYVALRSQTQEFGTLIACAGVLDPKDSDDLSTIADALIRKDGVSKVFVWGVIGDHKVRISARSTDITQDLGEFLKARFGNGNAGAKLAPDGHSEGGAMITLNFAPWLSSGNMSQALELISARMRELIFK